MRNVLSKEDLKIATKQLSKNHDHNWVRIGDVFARVLAVDYHSFSIPRILIHGLNSNNVSYTSLLKWSKNRKRNGKIYLSSYFPPPRKDNSDQFNAQWVSLSDVEEFYHNPNDQYDSINIGDSVKVVVRGTWHIAKVVGMYSYWVKEADKSHTILALDVPGHNDFKSSEFYSHHGMLDPNFKGEKVFLANSLFIGSVVSKAPKIQANKNNIKIGDFVNIDLGNRTEKAIVKKTSEDGIEYILAKEAHLKYDSKSYFHKAKYDKVKTSMPRDLKIKEQETNYPLEAIYRISARKILLSSKSLIEKFISQSSNVSLSKIGSLLETNIGNALVGYFASSYLQDKIKNSPRINKLVEEIRLESMLSVSETVVDQLITSSFSQEEVQEQLRLLAPLENLISDQIEDVSEEDVEESYSSSFQN